MQSYIKHHRTMYIFGSILDRWYPQNSFGQIEMWFQSLETYWQNVGRSPSTIFIHTDMYIQSLYIYIYPHIYIYKSGTNQLQSSDHFRWNSSKYLSSRPFRPSGECPDHSHEHPVHGLRGFCWLGGRCTTWTLHVACPMWGKDSQTIGGVVWWWNPIGFTGESSFFPL